MSGTRLWLRLTVAVDIEEDLRLLLWADADPQRVLTWEIRKPCFWQIFEIELTGIREVLQGEPRLTIFLQSPDTCRLWLYLDAPEAIHTPHLLASDEDEGSWKDLHRALCTSASLQPFGWLEGCVMDGIAALRPDSEAQSALEEHWNYFIADCGNLSYLNPSGRRVHRELYSIESTLPFANPPASGLDWDIILDFWNRNSLSNGLVADINVSPVGKPSSLTGISAEGCYTVGYPMARLAGILEDPGLFTQAQVQLTERSKVLQQADAVFQKQYIGRDLYFPNWGRAVGWFLIGHGQTLREIPQDLWVPEPVENFRRLCELALKWQLDSGLWAVFIDRDLPVDTSGSAAILGGLAIARSMDLIGAEVDSRISTGIDAMEQFISADGLLRGCAQLNRGGEELQVSPYRVIAPFAMGLAVRAQVEWERIRNPALNKT
jgi:hypothetical protein